MKCLVDDGECVSGRLRKGHCERHYRRLLRHGSTESPRRLPLLARYEIVDGCHRWKGPTYPNGYGKLSRDLHGTRLVHRAAWIERHGPISDDVDLDHRCHQPPCPGGPECLHRRCLNVEHLQPVTHAENLKRGHQVRTMCKARRHDITVPGALIPGTRRCVRCAQARQGRSIAARAGRRRAARA